MANRRPRAQAAKSHGLLRQYAMSESGRQSLYQMQTPLRSRWWLLDKITGRILDSSRRPFEGVPVRESEVRLN